MIKEIFRNDEKRQIAQTLLFDLPEWFGIPECTLEYIDKSSNMPFFAAFYEDLPIGFIALKPTSQYTAEIYCMGVLKKYHRKGYGKELFAAFEEYAKSKEYKLLQVKTVQQGTYEIYDKTNSFYKALGFYELEVFPTLWDDCNPCQIFVKPIS